MRGPGRAVAALVRFSDPKITVQVLLGFGERLGRADMHPHAVHAYAMSAARSDRSAPHQVQRKGAVGARVEEARVGDGHAGERERDDLLLHLTTADPAIALQCEVAAALVAMTGRS